MKGRIVRGLNSISTPTWTLSQAIQPFLASKDRIHCVVDVDEGNPASCPSSDREAGRTRDVDSVSELLSDDETNENMVKCKEEEEEEEKLLSITDFEDRCPSGGTDSIVMYTTSLRGIRKTFEDCNTVRFLLDSFRVVYSERDISMHLEYREELWGVLGGRVVPPKLFIKGRYIGGADEVVTLHEKGMLQNLLRGIPLSPSSCPCKGCAGMRFVLCPNCNGSRKVVRNDDDPCARCPDCNENGLVKCSVCS